MVFSVSISPSGASADKMNVGQTIEFTATPDGETGNVTYQWSVDGEEVENETTDTFEFIPEETGINVTVSVYAEDEAPSNATDEVIIAAVTAELIASIKQPKYIKIIVDEELKLEGLHIGGSTIASRDWTVDNVSQSEDAENFTFSSNTSGEFEITYKVVDSSDADDKDDDDYSEATVIIVVNEANAVGDLWRYFTCPSPS